MKTKKRMSLSSKFALGELIIIILLIGISQVVVGVSFEKKAMYDFYSSAENVLKTFSNSINIFFNSKEAALKGFSDSDPVKMADDTIHSFVNEVGSIKISTYEKSPSEQMVRIIAKSFSQNDHDVAEIYLGTKWGGICDKPFFVNDGRL